MDFKNVFIFKTFFLVEGAWYGIGWGGKGKGGEWSKGEGSGEGLVNFHLIFQKTWSEPGNPS